MIPFGPSAIILGDQFMQFGRDDSFRWTALSDAPQRSSQEEMELVHLEKYCDDYRRQCGDSPFESAIPGANPPDFVVTTRDGDEMGTDCAVFADANRRRSLSMMRHLVERLKKSARGRDFSGIQGCQLAVHFSENMSASVPTQRARDEILESLLDSMAAHQFDREAWQRRNIAVAADPDRMMLEPWPDVGEQSVPLPTGAGFQVAVICAESESHLLPSGLGFEVVLNESPIYSVDDLFGRLVRLVTDHDDTRNPHLLITAGGPDQDHYCHPEEESSALFLLDRHPDLQSGARGLSVEHLSRITLHFWSTGRIADIPLTTSGPEQVSG